MCPPLMGGRARSTATSQGGDAEPTTPSVERQTLSASPSWLTAFACPPTRGGRCVEHLKQRIEVQGGPRACEPGTARRLAFSVCRWVVDVVPRNARRLAPPSSLAALACPPSRGCRFTFSRQRSEATRQEWFSTVRVAGFAQRTTAGFWRLLAIVVAVGTGTTV